MTQSVTRWGIMATGSIARTFSKDLLLEPSIRGVHDITHVISAVASSSSLKSAESFVEDVGRPSQPGYDVVSYGSYNELVNDNNVDIIYIATPHSHHFEHAQKCLDAKKHVLCEKPLTVTTGQAEVLIRKARENNLFLMEGAWTRFFPLSIAVRDLVTSGKIGDILRGTADLSHLLSESEWSATHRLMNKDLAGGALMDIGPYPILWLVQTMWHTLPHGLRKDKPRVLGTSMTKSEATGVDIMTTVLLEFPHSAPSGASVAQGIATTAFTVRSDPDGKHTAGAAVRLYGTKGEVQIFGPIYRPERYKIVMHDGEVIEKDFEIPCGAYGMFWEADEAARCIRDGRTESETMPWEESLLVAELLDKARDMGGLVFPGVAEHAATLKEEQ